LELQRLDRIKLCWCTLCPFLC